MTAVLAVLLICLTSKEALELSLDVVLAVLLICLTVAHQFAKEALELSLDVVWMEECPSFILNTVIAKKVSF
jgi:hypothetical protein